MSGRRKGNKKSETRGRPLSSSIPLVQQKRSVLYLKKKKCPSSKLHNTRFT